MCSSVPVAPLCTNQHTALAEFTMETLFCRTRACVCVCGARARVCVCVSVCVFGLKTGQCGHIEYLTGFGRKVRMDLYI